MSTPLKQVELHVPTLYDRLEDFDALFQLWKTVDDYSLNVTFDFTACNFLYPNAVAFLGGLAKLIQKQNRQFQFIQMPYEVIEYLGRNDFFDHLYGTKSKLVHRHDIPYREDQKNEPERILDYLNDEWLGRGWIHISEKLQNRIVGRVYEIYANTFDHAESSIGVFTCGQHFPRKNQLQLAVVDFGVGIPANVRHFLGRDRLKASDCLQWAFQEGNTTKPQVSRGMGLDLLKEFVRINQGKLEIFSHEGYAYIDAQKELYDELNSFFRGTLVNIVLQSDERYYRFASETVTGPLF